MRGVVYRLGVWIVAGLVSAAATAQIDDLTTWTGVEDPPAEFLSFLGQTADSVSVLALNGPVEVGADIGYASVDGPSVAASTAGYYFDKDSDFSVAVDFDLSFTPSPVGGLGIGFGLGEDASGANSAGVGVFTVNGQTTGPVAGAARVNNDDQGLTFLNFNALTTGSFYVAYSAAAGNVIVGVSPTLGATSGFTTAALGDFKSQWSGQDLLLSFFIRSDDLSQLDLPVPLPAWSGGGQATAVFSDLRVLNGQAVAVPEPSSALLLAGAGLGLMVRRRA